MNLGLGSQRRPSSLSDRVDCYQGCWLWLYKITSTFHFNVLFVTTLSFCSSSFSQCRKHYRAGRYIEALRSSQESLYFNKIGFAIGISLQIVLWVMVLLSVIVPFSVILSITSSNN